jgi:hypothetical protein
MQPLRNVVLYGDSGQEYIFNVFPREAEIRPHAGVFIFARRLEKEDGPGYEPLLLGQAEDVSAPDLTEEQRRCMERRGCDALLVHPNGIPHSRLYAETDLLDALEPPCN